MKNLLIVSGMFVVLVGGGALTGGAFSAFCLFCAWCFLTYQFMRSA